jgi:predicted GIY-YIG superfamily endonuclease
MGGAVVEELDRSGARGIFATHLHGVLDLGLNLSPFAKRMMMETREDNDGRLRPTLRMVPGECRESLALQTATDMGVSDEVVHRSQELLAQIPETVVVGKTAPAAEEEASPTAAALAAAPPLESLRELLVSVGSLELGTVPEAGIVHAQDVPPPAARAWSCVYVLRRGDGWAYCGESDDLSGRLASHRANAAREGSSDVECTFITVPREGGGKSRARALESRVIRKLRAEGIPLLSGSDARNTSFGSAA